jgi:hypothetical protein
MKIDALLYIAERMEADLDSGGNIFFCDNCYEALRPGQDIHFDHRHAHGLGGEHSYKNLYPMHAECHREKTFGSKATTAGSDIHKIAKVKRIAKGGKKRRGRKLKSRPFPSVVSNKKWPSRRLSPMPKVVD